MRREVQAFNQRVDAHVRKQLDTLQGPVSCSKGCAGCCRQLTLIATVEAQNIVETYPEIVRRALPVLKAQVALLDAEAERRGIPPVLTTETRNAFSDAWWLAGQSCAFLVDGLCSIYPQRPLACRTYFVRSDPALCHDPGVGRIVDVVEPGALLPGFVTLLDIGTRHDEANVGDMPSAMLHAWGRR
jgi:Fe-S-cluster containining protein